MESEDLAIPPLPFIGQEPVSGVSLFSSSNLSGLGEGEGEEDPDYPFAIPPF